MYKVTAYEVRKSYQVCQSECIDRIVPCLISQQWGQVVIVSFSKIKKLALKVHGESYSTPFEWVWIGTKDSLLIFVGLRFDSKLGFFMCIQKKYWSPVKADEGFKVIFIESIFL